MLYHHLGSAACVQYLNSLLAIGYCTSCLVHGGRKESETRGDVIRNTLFQEKGQMVQQISFKKCVYLCLFFIKETHGAFVSWSANNQGRGACRVTLSSPCRSAPSFSCSSIVTPLFSSAPTTEETIKIDNAPKSVAVFDNLDVIHGGKQDVEVPPLGNENSVETEEDTTKQLIIEMETATNEAVDALSDDLCEIDPETGEASDPEMCADVSKFQQAKEKLKNLISKTVRLVSGSNGSSYEEDDDVELMQGEILEQGWEERGSRSALRRNAEVWKFALKCVFKALKPRSLRKKGSATEEEIRKAQIEAALFIRDGLLRLGPTFVKLGQVISTRTDVLPKEYTDVLKTLQDDVPGFSGRKAKAIVAAELGKPCDDIFTDFSEFPIAAASLGQVHTAKYKGKKVAIKVQRGMVIDLSFLFSSQ